MPTTGVRHWTGARRTAGPWPAWVRHWTMTTGGIARDLAINEACMDLMLAGIMRPGQLVAQRFGVSRSTVYRARARAVDWLSPTGWPPPIPHGHGLSAADRRRAILSAQGYATQDDSTVMRMSRYEAQYEVPVPDVEDEDGQGWASWTG